MITIEKILADKREEIAGLTPSESSADRRRARFSFADSLKTGELSIIAEIKRSSPSTGPFNIDILRLRDAYLEAGVDALSILTDRHFEMSRDDLRNLAGDCPIPVLRKDFILSRKQIDESVEIGADAILLIAGFLGEVELEELGSYAASLGLDILYEAHSDEEIVKIPNSAVIVGVNNRDLTGPGYATDTDYCARAVFRLPKSAIKVAESGYDHITPVPHGFDAVLIGTSLIREFMSGGNLKEMISKIRRRDGGE